MLTVILSEKQLVITTKIGLDVPCACKKLVSFTQRDAINNVIALTQAENFGEINVSNEICGAGGWP